MVKERTNSPEIQEDDTETRTSRDMESRETEARPSDAWIPANLLPIPKPEPGYVFKWVRSSFFDKADTKNVSKSLREGWVPVRAEDYPDLKITSDIGSQFKGNIEYGGLLLCKMPEERAKARQRHFQELSARQIKSVDEGFMQDNDPRMRKFSERSTRTQFGKG